MKTVEELEDMIKQSGTPFGTAYNYLIASLSNCYVSKSNGMDLIRNELSDWDTEARSLIIKALIREIRKTGVHIDSDDIMELNGLAK